MLAKFTSPYKVTAVIPLLISLLVICTVIPTLVLTYLINSANSSALLSARAELLVDGLENQLRGLLDPVDEQMRIARDYIQERDMDLDDEEQFQIYVDGLLTGTEQVSGIGIIRPDGSMRRWEKGVEGAIEEPSEMLPLVGQALRVATFSDDVLWSAPFVSLVLDDIILNPRITLRRNGEFTGILTAGVTSRQLSQYVTRLSQQNVTAFILYDRDKLIAHPQISVADSKPVSTELPGIESSNLSIIRDIWKDINELTQTNRMQRTQGHWSSLGDTQQVYFYRELEGYGPENLLVGVALPTDESFWFRWAALISAALGAVLLAIAVVAAFMLARRLSSPVVQIENALVNLQNMEFDKVRLPNLDQSRISEWRSSASNLVSTANALSLFNQYVPSKLARRLMQSPADAAVAQERMVTVMFIDMEGFSAFAQDHSAAEASERLNRVFGIIGPIIEENGGVIDKYTGDGLMAFWGAPDEQPDHPQQAIFAARKIMKAIIETSSQAWFDGTPRLRIGMHAGPAIVGNLGFEGRINYTLVGSTVNTAERVEQAMRAKNPDQVVVVGISQEMYELASPFEGHEACETIVVHNRKIKLLN